MNSSTKHATLSQRACAALLFLYIGEIILGGALGLQPAGIPLRKLLITALLACFFASLLGNYRFKYWQLGLLGGLSFLIVGWGSIIPLIKGTNLSHTAAEITPLAGLLLTFPIMQAIRVHGAQRYLEFANRCTAAVAMVVIIAWALATFFDRIEFALGLKILFLYISGDDFGTYIGPMPDGSFRVMWITCMLFPFMLIYKNYNRFNPQWTIFYLIAIYATGTRSFLYVALFILAALLLRRRPVIAAVAIPLVLTAAIAWSNIFEDTRLFQIAPEFDLDSPRSEQFFSLMRLFSENPLFGAGFGAHADILRSEDSPYSYELTYVALLAKLGSFGFMALLLAAAAGLHAAMARYRRKSLEIMLLVISFVAVTATNPYLINAVGITILSFMIAAAFADSRIRKTPRSIFGTQAGAWR